MKVIGKSFGADLDLEKIPDDADTTKIIEITNKALDYLEFLNKFLSFGNFNGFIAKDIIIPATSSIIIQHYLGVVPKYRIILRQIGNGVITDVNNTPYDWNDKVVTLYNNGAVSVTLTVFIARE